ncbi:MAG: DUF1684 domain-containing protein [Acidobacteria bacterium]|nr:DUF1684 domain-containing protein [Acidobacteriota bacterium]
MRMLIVSLAGIALAMAASFQDEIAQWRRQREDRLKAESGWLTVSGLFWLHEGANTFGKDPANEIVLPDGPAHAGVFTLKDGKVTVGTGSEARELWADSMDFEQAGRVKLFVIKRGERYGIRERDPDSEYRRNFHGIDCYPASEAYRVTARFIPDAKDIPILNVLGQTEPLKSPGVAVFELGGKEYRLRPVFETPDAQELFYIFKDETSGRETYGAGRFLYSALPKDGTVVLDFNKAYNPPCAFTPYATCPLPPAENKLPVRIEAGEKKYGQH